ncbi:unknown [Bacteroides sp. CAG:633]|uniref:hypothetical protein n=1 Tax=Bacteroides sp. CAG:633 TaxID=1262744 RepID=UPI00033D905B|nr:hypothetical protein [Bacteroides sp. CAG:633]CDB11708.1 unknown [Bacteroides sp. CAG:633]
MIKIENLKGYKLTDKEKLYLLAILQQAEEEKTDTIKTNIYELDCITETDYYNKAVQNLKEKNFINYTVKNKDNAYEMLDITLTKKSLNILQNNANVVQTDALQINAEGKRIITLIL